MSKFENLAPRSQLTKSEFYLNIHLCKFHEAIHKNCPPVNGRSCQLYQADYDNSKVYAELTETLEDGSKVTFYWEAWEMFYGVIHNTYQEAYAEADMMIPHSGGYEKGMKAALSMFERFIKYRDQEEKLEA